MSSDWSEDAEELSGMLMLAVAQVVSEPIDELEQAHALRSIQAFPHTSQAGSHLWPWGLVGATAASLLIGWLAWHSFGRSAWAEVVASVSGRPWLHAVGQADNGTVMESWYSPSRRVMAVKVKNGAHVFFWDGEADVLETYDADGRPPAIHRAALDDENRRRWTEGGLLQALLADDFETALAGLDARIIDQQRRTITVEGQPRHEYRLVVAGGDDAGMRREVTALVDPATKLPITLSTSIRDADGKVVFEDVSVLDYPASGPNSIHALGVPRDAPLVDNVPRGDLQRALRGLAIGRTRFDDYRGLVIWGSPTPVPRGDSGLEMPYQVWRCGLQWRIERIQRKRLDAMPDDVDPATWWNQQLAGSRLILERLSTGSEYFELTLVPSQPHEPDPDFPRYLKIARFEKEVRSLFGSSDPLSRQSELELAECIGYPTLLGEYSASYAMTINTHPADGPPGCVLVESRGTTGGRGPAIGERVWLDPTRGYLVLRRESRGSPSMEVMDVAQSPSGRWYPTRLRVIGGRRSRETGETEDSYVNYHLDFNAEFPDDLFEAPP